MKNWSCSDLQFFLYTHMTVTQELQPVNKLVRSFQDKATHTTTNTHSWTVTQSGGELCDEVSPALLRRSGSICACISCHNRKRGTAPPDKTSVCVCVCVCVEAH